jgi:ATP-dependent Zn protease/intein/homing endonuclease
MSTKITEADLPKSLTPVEAVEAAYSQEMAEVASKLVRGLPTLVECDKELAPYLFMNVRDRLRQQKLQCIYLDGRQRDPQQGAVPMGLIGTMIAQLRDAVRGATERRVVVLPHLDLLTTSQGGLTGEAREVIPLLYENPELVWLGFKDPSFPLPKVIENLFPHWLSILGTSRNRLHHLITQKESRKFGKDFSPWQLYKHVSGVNAVRLRRLLSTLEGEDYPSDPKRAYAQLRQATLSGQMEIPSVDLDKDIGGYAKVKAKLKAEILDSLQKRDKAMDAKAVDKEEVARLEELIPRGMIFWGPPGTGKTYFAKAIAASIGAAITIVSGPELKSKWVGESLPYEEEVFVILNGEARRIAIGELVEKHAKDDVRTWTVRDDGSALLAPVTGFLKHKGPNYIDVLVTETGREVRVTGGHSLFVRNADDTLGEVFAEQVAVGETRVAVPLRLEAPETLRELNLLEMFAGRDDVRVQGYDAQVARAVEEIGFDRADAATGVATKTLTQKQRAPLTVSAFERLMSAADAEPDARELSLYCWHRNKALPAILPLTEDLGEFLGRWVADGCFHRTGVRIATHIDEADQVQALCERLFGHVTRYTKEGSKGVDLVMNATLVKYLLRDGLGMRDGSAHKRVPAALFLAPKPVIAAFLRGYFSGDGTFSKKYIEATTVSRELAHDVVTLLQFFGIAARVRRKEERNGAPAFRVRFLWSGFLRTFADHIGFADARRQTALREYVDGMTFQRDLQTPAQHITNDVYWDKVVEKRREPYAREHVYDLSVPETERFIAGFGNVLVHNSEENLRQIFHKARQSAPSIIVFDELDSFATARGTYTGSGVEHSMVNQLLTEMDGFHKDELVFVVGTTNFVESLDPALLRPGRFEFHIHIPYPDDDDRKAIFQIYDKKMRLQFTDEALEYAVNRTGNRYMTPTGTAFSGDHLNALCRAVARLRMRENLTGETTPKLIEKAITEFDEKKEVHEKDVPIVAVHEAGHFLVSIFCPNHPPPEKVTIQSDMPWAPFFTQFKQEKNRIGMSRGEMLDVLAVLYGGIEAERLVVGDVSTGASGMGSPGSDLSRGTDLAELIVEVCGMSNLASPLRSFRNEKGEREVLSGSMAEAIDRQVNTVIVEAQARAAAILTKHKADLIKLRDELMEKKTIEGERTKQIIEQLRAKYPKDVGAPGPEVKLAAGAGTTAAPSEDKAKPKKKDGE